MAVSQSAQQKHQADVRVQGVMSFCKSVAARRLCWCIVRTLMEVFLKYTIPLITFILGAWFTLLIKNREKRETVLSIASTQLSELCTEWYTQLHEIYIASQDSLFQDSSRRILFHYERNRLVLPKFIRELEILKGYREGVRLF